MAGSGAFGSFKAFLNRIPFATLFASVLCVIGSTLFMNGFRSYFDIRTEFLGEVSQRNRDFRTILVVFTVLFGLTGLLNLVLGVTSTGLTRETCYASSRGARVGGRVCSLLLILYTYFNTVLWMVAVFLFALDVQQKDESQEFICRFWDGNSPASLKVGRCLEVRALSFFGLRGDPTIKLCSEEQRREFCDNLYETQTGSHNAMIIFGLFFMIMGSVHYLMCLAVNNARIKDQAHRAIVHCTHSSYEQPVELDSLPQRFVSRH